MCIPQSNQSDDLAQRINEVAAQFEREARGASLVVYAILDPGRPDPLRQYSGTPIYVGETRHPAERFLAHAKYCTPREKPMLPVKRELKRMIESGYAPAITVLEECRTRSESLKAELEWSQSLVKQGYALSNGIPGQSRVVSTRHFDKLIANRLWKLTFLEAVEEGMTAKISCPNGCFENPIDLETRSECEAYDARIAKLKKLVKRCEVCHRRSALEVHLPNGSNAVWRLPSYEKCKKRKRVGS
ncbi:MAG: hypothetical protein AAFY51_04720 [Pseudomonadota bacterium]